MERRKFIVQAAALVGAAAAVRGTGLLDVADAAAETLPSTAFPATLPSSATRAPLPSRVIPVAPPITDAERLARIEKARRLMIRNGIDAILLEGGSSMFYYTGVRWGNSERPFTVVIPARGELAWVTPGFEEQRARELIRFGTDIRVWQEDENPYRVIAGILRDRGARGTVGIEERLRFFIADGVRQIMPRARFVSATPVTAGCRMIKSPAELALMQQANDITLSAIGTTLAALKEGMSNKDVSNAVGVATRALGGTGDGGLVIFGKYTAFPHGSVQPQTLKEGDVVLLDTGCTVDGYASDITRTTVFGTPTQRQRDVWELEKRAQRAAIDAAQVGATCESVDDAARAVITAAGYGPDYKLPGVPHRTGHGIGLDGHEWTNFVRGNKTRLAPGMCFSAEPTIVNYAEFGIRLEDCLYITENGPKLFTPLSPSIEQPV